MKKILILCLLMVVLPSCYFGNSIHGIKQGWKGSDVFMSAESDTWKLTVNNEIIADGYSNSTSFYFYNNKIDGVYVDILFCPVNYRKKKYSMVFDNIVEKPHLLIGEIDDLSKGYSEKFLYHLTDPITNKEYKLTLYLEVNSPNYVFTFEADNYKMEYYIPINKVY